MFSPLELKLRKIVGHIEQSSLPVKEKDALYARIKEELRESVKPVLLEHFPEEKLTELMDEKTPITAEGYLDAVAQTIQKKGCMEEVERVIAEVLADVEEILREQMIIL